METNATTIAPVSKKLVWTGRIISGLISAFMLFGAVFTLVNPDAVKKDFAAFGYPEGYLQGLIITEIGCVVLYLIPQTAVLGAILMTGYLGGAVATHVRMADPGAAFPVVFGILVWLALLFREPRLRPLIPLRKC
ncbi:MAG TPA: DoxX family protein [Tepidisphaeraceae bacterium]|nr:DoxX family protein [Tepidisphaeraceae bacterium]